jgi:hypothetical protein
VTELYGDSHCKRLAMRFTSANRSEWPASVVIALDSEVWGERHALNHIFDDFPKGSTKKDLVSRLRSEDDQTFIGGWAQLRVWALLEYRGLKPMPEPVLEGVSGRPDYGFSWPVRQGARENGLVEVFAASTGSKTKAELRKKLFDRLAEKAGKYSVAARPYLAAVVVGGPPCSDVLRLAASDLADLHRDANIESYGNLSATLLVETHELGGDGHVVDTRQSLIRNRNASRPIDDILPRLLSHELTDDEACELGRLIGLE